MKFVESVTKLSSASLMPQVPLQIVLSERDDMDGPITGYMLLQKSVVCIDVAREKYWKSLKACKKWMKWSACTSFCSMIHYVSGEPETVSYIGCGTTHDGLHQCFQAAKQNELDVQGKLKERMYLELRCDINPEMLVVYLIPFQDKGHHFGVILAFPQIRSVLTMDGYSKAAKYWRSWVFVLLFCLGEDWETLNQVYFSSKQKSFQELLNAARETSHNGKQNTNKWICYAASDGIKQNNNSTECGYIACMYVWSKIYGNAKNVNAPSPEDYALHQARPRVIDQYISMQNFLGISQVLTGNKPTHKVSNALQKFANK